MRPHACDRKRLASLITCSLIVATLMIGAVGMYADEPDARAQGQSANGESTHPFYWASFVAAGDWR